MLAVFLAPETLDTLFSFAFGFTVAGLCASDHRLFSRHFPSFRLLEMGPVPARFAAIPLLIFSAPFIIMRDTVRIRRLEGLGAEVVMLASLAAGLWSLMSGTVVVLALRTFL